jgi:tRNA(Arg) A34 adenosine deaminase TadA
MAMAIEEAKLGAAMGEQPFGAVVARNGEVIVRTRSLKVSTFDTTAHSETLAIKHATQKLKQRTLPDCVFYCTCEPCPMCLSAIYWARVRTVFYGNTRKDAAKIAFDDDFIYREVALPMRKRSLKMKQLLRDEALKAFHEWDEKTDKIPY